MDPFLITISSIAAAGLLYIFLFKIKKKKRVTTVPVEPIHESYRQILSEQVPFYQHLDEARKTEFESRVQQFLSQTKITGVNTIVEELDKVLIAASAITRSLISQVGSIYNFMKYCFIQIRSIMNLNNREIIVMY